MLLAMKHALLGILGAALMSVPALAGAATATPTAVDVLFERRHLDGLGQGAALTYRFQRTVSDAKMLGEPFTDEIQIGVNKVSDAGRELGIQIFSGERARERQTVPDMTGNPLLVVFLDRCVANMSRLTGAQGPYLKGAFRAALREKAKIEPTQVDYAGKSVAGFKVTVSPYEGDANMAKLQGYDKSNFSIIVSDQVPGHFVEFVSKFESSKPEALSLEERVTIAKVDGAALAATGGPNAGETK